MGYKILKWTRVGGQVLGRADVVFDGMIIIYDVAIIKGKNGPFAVMPSRPWKSREGKMRYSPIIEFADKDRAAKFSDSLVERLMVADPTAFGRTPNQDRNVA